MTPGAGLTEELVALPGGPARVLRAGDRGQGPALVLVHGAGQNHRAFDAVLPYLGGLDVIVPALPGRCGSAGAAFEGAFPAARWIRGLIAHLEVDSWVVCGYSYGGAIAIECALEEASGDPGADPTPGAPPLVGLALVSTGARLRVRPSILAMAGEAVRRGAPLVLDSSFYRPGADPARVRAAAEAEALTPPEAACADWHASNAFDRMADLPRIAVPTLVVAGAEDALTPPKYAAYLAANIPGARLVAVEPWGHALPVEAPEALGRALAEHTRALEAPLAASAGGASRLAAIR